MFGSIGTILGGGHAFRLDVFVCEFFIQALVNEMNRTAGTNAVSSPTGGGTVFSLYDLFSTRRTPPKPPKRRPKRSSRLLHLSARKRMRYQKKVRIIGGIDDIPIGICNYQKDKNTLYKMQKINIVDASVKDELFVVMAATIPWDDKGATDEEIDSGLGFIRNYIDGLSEDQAAGVLGRCVELRNRGNIVD